MKQMQFHVYLIVFIFVLSPRLLSSMDELQTQTTRQLQQELTTIYIQQGLRTQQAKRYVKKISIELQKFSTIFNECPYLQISDEDNFVIYDYQIQKICIKTIFFLALPSLGNSFTNGCFRQMAEETFNTEYTKEFSEQVEPPSSKKIKRFLLKTLIYFVTSNHEIFTFPEPSSAEELEPLETSAHEESSPDDYVVIERNPDLALQGFTLAPVPHTQGK